MVDIAWIVGLVIFLVVNQWMATWLYHRRIRRTQERFLRHLRIEHPDSTIVLSAMASSDLDALRKLKRQLDELS